MSKEFMYQIGDVVANSLYLDEVRKFSESTDVSMRPLTLRVEERIFIECVGGVQLFYTCRAWDGSTQKHSEDILVKAEVLWDAWMDGLKKQEARKSKL